MELKVVWINSTRMNRKKEQIEQKYASFIIDHFGTAEEAFKAKESFNAQNKHPHHPWNIANVKAHNLSTRSLWPSEARTAAFRLDFMGD